MPSGLQLFPLLRVIMYVKPNIVLEDLFPTKSILLFLLQTPSDKSFPTFWISLQYLFKLIPVYFSYWIYAPWQIWGLARHQKNRYSSQSKHITFLCTLSLFYFLRWKVSISSWDSGYSTVVLVLRNAEIDYFKNFHSLQLSDQNVFGLQVPK